MSNTVAEVRRHDQGPFLVRVIWFFLLGWHLSLYWIVIAWLLNLTIIGLPLGAWMLNRVPLVLTLRMPPAVIVGNQAADGSINWTTRRAEQPNILLRLVYFLIVGWWLSLAWSLVAWLLCVTILGLPIGVWMLNRLPNVTTLANQ